MLAPAVSPVRAEESLTEGIVRFAFADMPEMIGIAKCESGFRQFNQDGSVLRGSGRYIGIFQIDEPIHATKALGMGMDISTIDGNIAYARHLNSISGTGPWKGCVGTPAPVIPATTPAPAASGGTLSANLNIGMTNPQILILQQILNRLGFSISATGPGSPGNETNYFGSLTREAVRKFQCAKGITCTGSEGTTGYGRVGPMTRSILNSL